MYDSKETEKTDQFERAVKQLLSSNNVQHSPVTGRSYFIESERIEERRFIREDVNRDTCILELVSVTMTELLIIFIFLQ